MVKFFVLSRFIVRFYKSNIVFLYFLVISHNFAMYFQKGFFMINSNTFSNFNSKYPIYADLHTHSISSGHGSEDTITDMIRCASESGLSFRHFRSRSCHFIFCKAFLFPKPEIGRPGSLWNQSALWCRIKYYKYCR